MTGIAGIIRFDEQGVAPADTTNVTALLKHRGPLSKQEVNQGILMAFGNTVEVNTANSLYAAADADIFSKALSDEPFTTNFAVKGPAFFNELNADFAVAIWDARQQTLVFARDPLGIKPLYFVHRPGCFIAFASEIKALLALPEVLPKPNRHKFREYLTWATSYIPYTTETFYEGIYSVLPGHYIQVTAQQVSTTAYWQIDPQKFRGLAGAEAYSDLFNDYFTKAVDSRISGRQNIGAHLSGGLDSSSVSCVAQQVLSQQQRPSLHTFNIDPKQPSADEQEYVRAVVDYCHPLHHTVYPVADVLDSVLKINHLFDRPEQFIIPSSFHLSVSLEARQVSCDILLTGHDGDSTIPTGFDFLDELLDASDWEQLKTACEQVVSYPDRTLYYVNANWPRLSTQAKYEQYVLFTISSMLKKRFSEQSGTSFLKILREQQRVFGLSPGSILSHLAKRIQNKLTHQSLIDNALNAEFKQQIPNRPQQTTKELVTNLSSEHRVALNQVLHTTNVICNEQMNHIGAYYGHSYSFPFFDKNVVELGLATPLEVHFDKGRGRGLIRNGLRDVLPPEVVSRHTKANFVEYGTLSAQQLYQETHELFTSISHPIWEVIDQMIFAKIVGIVFNPRFPARKKTRYNWLLSRIIYLALWLGSLPKGR